MGRYLLLFLALGLIGACGGARDLGPRLAAANLLAGSIAAGLDQAIAHEAMMPGHEAAAAMLVTLAAIEVALDGAGEAWRADLQDLARANLDAAERQMAGLQPLLPAPPAVSRAAADPFAATAGGE